MKGKLSEECEPTDEHQLGNQRFHVTSVSPKKWKTCSPKFEPCTSRNITSEVPGFFMRIQTMRKSPLMTCFWSLAPKGLSEVRRHCSLLWDPISLPSYTSPYDRHFHSLMALHLILLALVAVFYIVILYTVTKVQGKIMT
jgi:hypothetical protein